NISVNNNTGVCGATVSWTAPTSADNCAGSTIAQTAGAASGTVFPIGVTTVIYIATDIHSNVQTASFTVTVFDNTKPIISGMPANITINSNSANTATCTQVASWIAPTASDNCSVATFTSNYTSGASFPVGTTTVTYTATDVNNNVQTASFTITVNDNTKPVITCPSNITAHTDDGLCAKTFTLAQIGTASAKDNCSATVTWIRSDGAMLLNALFSFGSTTITWKATDPSGNFTTCDQTININNVTTRTSVTVTPNPQQYSDLVTFVATVTNCDGAAMGGTVTFKVGSQIMGTAIVDANGTATLSDKALLELSYPSGVPIFPSNGQMEEGSKVVTADFAGTANAFVSSGNTNLTITREDAVPYYTGSSFVSTASTTSSTATVILSATIKDMTAVNSSIDPNSGDIRNARVRFVNRDLTPTAISSATSTTGYYISDWLAVGLVSSGDTKTGTATTNWTASIGSSDAQQFTIGVIIDNNGYYFRNNSDDNTVITVSKPLNDFVTGGGFIIMSKAIGGINPQQGKKNNFGFNIKRNKNGGLQGNINTIVRSLDGKTYQVKGNVMSSLSVSPAASNSPAKAVFNGKANIQNITDPLNVISVDGNATLQVTMTDKGEPGKNDDISIIVWDKNSNVWYSSNWDGTRTQQQVLDGGNIKIHSTGSFSTGTASSSVSLSSSLNPSTVGQSVTFTATVTGNLTTKPTGIVNFVDVMTNTVLGSIAINATTGIASLSVGSLSAALHTITAYYGGDSRYAVSSNSFTQTVNSAHSARTSAPVIAKQVDEIAVETVPFNVIAYPNPSNQYFNVEMKGGSTEKVDIMVYDVLGRTIKHIDTSNGQEIKFGDELSAGVYIAIIKQGDKQKTVKLIKQ
ncbi:HYR domain-containing protein, partial [Flavobacterium sp. GT2N3]|uniref:HYR domain-containing protein n=1 Tax=unclassified Flavobacterium TaxID=196869 RepID=UPI003AAFFB06